MSRPHKHGVDRWLPWSEFARMGRSLRAGGQGRTGREGLTIHGPALAAGLLIVATVAASVAVPTFTTPISIVGGLLVVVVLLMTTGEHRRLREGLQAAGSGWPNPADLARVIWRLCLDDLRRLMYGGSHHDDRMRD